MGRTKPEYSIHTHTHTTEFKLKWWRMDESMDISCFHQPKMPSNLMHDFDFIGTWCFIELILLLIFVAFSEYIYSMAWIPWYSLYGVQLFSAQIWYENYFSKTQTVRVKSHIEFHNWEIQRIDSTSDERNNLISSYKTQLHIIWILLVFCSWQILSIWMLTLNSAYILAKCVYCLWDLSFNHGYKW